MTTPNPTNDTGILLATAEDDVAGLCREALSHPGGLPPWCTTLDADHEAEALQGYVHHLLGFQASLPQQWMAAMAKQSDAGVHYAMARAFGAEQGRYDDDTWQALRGAGIAPRAIREVPRLALLRRLGIAFGLDMAELDEPTDTARRWRGWLLKYLANATPAAAFGAMVLGGAVCDRAVHARMLRALLTQGRLRRDDLTYLEVAVLLGRLHLPSLLDGAHRLIANGELDDLRAGMLEALRLRREFFDAA